MVFIASSNLLQGFHYVLADYQGTGFP